MQPSMTLFAFSFLSMLTNIGGAWAQQPARPLPTPRSQPPAIDSDEPQVTTASFGDWVERCQRLRTGTEMVRVCEAAQTIMAEGQNGPVAQLAIGRIKKTDPLRVTLVLPVNAGFPSAPKLKVDSKSAETVELAWRRCVSGGCVADAPITEPILALWRAETVPGRIEAMTESEQTFQLSFSFRGLAQALAAMNKEEQ